MADLKKIQEQIRQRRKAFKVADDEYYQALQQHTLLKDSSDSTSQTEVKKKRQNREDARFDLHAAINLLAQSETPQRLLTQIAADIPFLLLPLRIEARYVTFRHVVRNLKSEDWIESTQVSTGLEQEEEGNWTYQVPQLQNEGGIFNTNSLTSKVKSQQIKPGSNQYIERKPDKDELCIRFYPDEVFKYAHEPNLMLAEWEAGKAFWEKIFTQSESQEKTWLNFSATMSPARAAWIIRISQPLNVTLGQPFPAQPKFPNDPPLKDGAYSLPPTTVLLPERLVARLYSATGTFTEFIGKPIPEPIRLGLDPTDDPFDERPAGANFAEENGNLKAPQYLQWVQNLETAEAQGLAVRIDLKQNPEFRDGVAKIIVLGAKLSADETESSQLLNEHFENCLYKEEGMSILPQGSPTNNFGDQKSGFNIKEKTSLAYFLSLFKAPKPQEGQLKSDEMYLRRFLGLNESFRIPNGEQTDIDEAKNMNKMLWHSTWGYYLLQFFSPALAENKREMLRQFFSQYVTGRGLLPVLRINQQPIGIIPTTNWSLWQNKGDTDEEKFLSNLWSDFLSKLKNHWSAAAEKVNAVSNNTTSSGNLDETFLEMLSVSASSIKFQGQILAGAGLKSILENLLDKVNSDIKPIITLEKQLVDITAQVAKKESEIRGNTVQIANLNVILNNPFLAKKFGKQKQKDTLQLKNSELNTQLNVLKNKKTSLETSAGATLSKRKSLLDSQKQLTAAIQNLKNGSITNLQADFSALPVQSFENVIAAQKLPVSDFLIDSLPVSEELPPEKLAGKSWNYLEWLLNAKLSDIWNNQLDSAPTGDGDPESKADASLFAMFVRQTMLRALLENHLKTTESNPGLWLLKAKDFELEQLESSGEIKFNPQALDPKNLLHQQYKPIIDAYKTELTAPIVLKTDRRHYFEKLDTSNLQEWIADSGSNPILKPLEELEKAFQTFKDVPTARLARLFTEHLDLCSYRLDAWMLGLLHQRLDKLRKTNPKGIQLGAFGYLLNLKPKNPRDIVVLDVEPTFIAASSQNFDRAAIPVVNTNAAKAKGIDLNTSTERAFFYIGEIANPRIRLNLSADKVEADPLINKSRTDGFIHMPSLVHATTAAIMRAGYLAHRADTQTETMSIDLTAPRVRKALQLMEGMQAGTQLAELLGHLFERALHDNILDGYRLEFRNAFPLNQDLKKGDKTTPMASLDGFALLKAFQSNPSNWLKSLKNTQGQQLTIPSKDMKPLNDIARSLEDDYLDSTGDLLLAESVYQTAKGNTDRAAAALRSLNTGGQALFPEFVNVPQNGYGLTHRVGIIFPSAPKTDKGNVWSSTPSPRTTLSPSLNKWLARQLPDPTKIRITVTLPDGTKILLRLSEIGIEPIDLLYQAPTSFRQGGACPLHLWIQSNVLNLPNFRNDLLEIPLSIDFKDRSGFDITEVTVFEVSALVLNLKKVLELSRSIQPADLSQISINSGKLDLQVLENTLTEHSKPSSNASALPQILRNFANQLHTSISENVPIKEQRLAAIKLCEPLLKASLYGIEEAGSEGIVSLHSERFNFLFDKAETVASIMEKRLEGLGQILAELPTDENQRHQALQQAAKELLGPDTLVYPLLQVANAPTLQNALDQRKQLLNTDDDTMDKWLSEAALVRKPMRYFRQVTILRELFPSIHDAFKELAVTQLPFLPQVPWIGDMIKESDLEKLTPELRPNTSILLETPENFKVSDSFTGILLDEWTEIIPSSVTHTGLTFQYDQPNTEPSQVMLLAVNPVEGGNWQWEHLMGAVEDALQLSKSRLVTPELLQKENKIFGDILPAMVVPFLANNANIPNTEMIKPKD
ncbi:hypothetical protein [Algoriphagus antarcticus]|uniref:Uncharacterized protein n=1 Tax=Algoriphagus antarcticus TaxID=238540 RepID=A0A3E0DY43_9BACT|nr:hypothetical protein [Algoriphagus antarcticus]REG90270.1 hypothetical protein C8N25_1077 [Algoriphagus antarcticus]